MNDIGIKVVDSPKDRLADASPVPDVCENEVDPLSIDEEEGSMKDPLIVEVKTEVEDAAPAAAENCDENAKEENVIETSDKEIDERLEEELLNEEELLKDDETGKLMETNIETVDIPEHTETKPPEEMKVKINERTPSPKELKKLSPSRSEEKAKSVSPKKEFPSLPAIEVRPSCSRDPDVDMIAVPPMHLKNDKHEAKPYLHPLNGDVPKEERGARRRASEDIDSDSPLKRLCQEVERAFPQHDVMINDYIQTTTKNSVEEIQRHTEQLLSEIQTLRELAQKKEHEWNNILHLKKVKEEILLRLLRRKQVLSFEKSPEVNGNEPTPGPAKADPFEYLNQPKNLAIDKSDEISGLSIKQPGPMMTPMIHPPMPVPGPYNHMPGLPPPYDKAAHLNPLAKPMYPQPILMPGPLPGYPRHDMNGIPTSYGMPMGRQGPTKDVKSIIADYRQRNPEVTPRRGRRMKSILNPNMMTPPRPIAPKLDGMNNLNNLNMLFNNLDMSQKAMLERLQQIQAGSMPNGVSFKDVLVQFANMQHTNAPLMPPRPMETMTRPEHHVRPEGRRRHERNHEENHVTSKQAERLASPSPRLPPPPPYPEISLLPVTSSQESMNTQNSLLHGILTKQVCPATQCYSPTLAKLLTSPDRKQTPTLPTYGQAKNCGEITITPVQPTPPPPEPAPEKAEVVQLDDEESPGSEGEAADTTEAPASPGGSNSGSGGGGGRLVIDEGSDETPVCQGCRRRDAQFVCAGCANQWYCSRDCQVAAWDDHSDMCTG